MAGNFSASTKLVRKEGEGGGFRGDDGSGTRKRVLWYGTFFVFFFFQLFLLSIPSPPTKDSCTFSFFYKKREKGEGRANISSRQLSSTSSPTVSPTSRATSLTTPSAIASAAASTASLHSRIGRGGEKEG